MKLIEKHGVVEVRRALGEIAARTAELPVDERWAARLAHDRQRLWASLVDEQRGVCDAATLSDDATRVLGLNEEVLTELRRATFDGIWKALKATKDHRNVARLRREKARWESAEVAEEWAMTPYAAAVAGWLRHEIERLEADA